MAAPAPTFESGPAGTCTEVADEASLRHTLWVIGATAPSVIDAIGGWLTDRALAGWEITVFLPESQKARSLQILGLTVLPLSQLWSAPGAPGRTALAVEGSLLQSDAMIRQHAIGMLADGAEITSWGASMPEEFGAHFLQVRRKKPGDVMRAVTLQRAEPEALFGNAAAVGTGIAAALKVKAIKATLSDITPTGSSKPAND